MPRAVKAVGSVLHGIAALFLDRQATATRGEEMAVPVTGFKRLDVPHAGLDGIADRAGSGARESCKYRRLRAPATKISECLQGFTGQNAVE
jgi:hypothetical protein